MISLLGGSKVQIGGPTGAFIVIIYGIIQEYGISGLTVCISFWAVSNEMQPSMLAVSMRFAGRDSPCPAQKPYVRMRSSGCCTQVRLSVVRAEHGWWFPETEGAEPNLYGVFDSNINNLTPQCENGDTGFGAPYANQLCRVYPCTEENSRVLPGEQVTRRGGYSKVIDESNGDVKVGAIYG